MATTSITPATVTKQRRKPTRALSSKTKSVGKYFGSTITIDYGDSTESYWIETNPTHEYQKGSYCNSVKQAHDGAGRSMAIKTYDTQKIALHILLTRLNTAAKGSEEHEKLKTILTYIKSLSPKQYTRFAYGVKLLSHSSDTILSVTGETEEQSTTKVRNAQRDILNHCIDLDMAKCICAAAKDDAVARAKKAVKGHQFLGEKAFHYVREEKVYLATPWREGCNLYTWIQAHNDPESSYTLSIDQRFDIAQQIATQLKKLHDRGIIFCDLKPSNIMVAIDSETGKAIAHLIDLDSYSETDGSTSFQSYTPNYLDRSNVKAFFDGKPLHISTAMDTYAFGRILGELFIKELNLCDDCPFKTKPLRTESSKVQNRLKTRKELTLKSSSTIEFTGLYRLWFELKNERHAGRPDYDYILSELDACRPTKAPNTQSAAGAGGEPNPSVLSALHKSGLMKASTPKTDEPPVATYSSTRNFDYK